MKNIIITCLFLYLFMTSLFAQTNFSEAEALNIFKTNPPKWGFEGVYEIYQRGAVKSSRGIISIITDKEFKSYNKKILENVIENF